MNDQRWEEIEHTADWALRVWGDTLRELFENAARGMIQLVGGEADPAQPRFNQAIRLTAHDGETLLIDWLSELLYLIEDEGVVFDDIRVQRVEDLVLEAQVGGWPGGRFTKHIKAATYHNLALHRGAAGYETTVVFDV